MQLPLLDTLLGFDGSVAILGAGNMGRIIASQLVGAGVTRERISISCKGSDSTIQAVSKIGMLDRMKKSNEDALFGARIVFICVRAQELSELQGLEFPKEDEGGLIVVITTGISFAALEKVTGGTRNNIVRAQVCGHGLIEAKRGIMACFPKANPVVCEMFKGMGYLVVPEITEEIQIHIFSCLMCCPAARVCLKHRGFELDQKIIERFIKANSNSGSMECLPAYFDWVMRESETILYTDDKGIPFDDYISEMFTRGGLTEALCLTILGEKPSINAASRPATPPPTSSTTPSSTTTASPVVDSNVSEEEEDGLFHGLNAALQRCLAQVQANDEILGIIRII